MFGRGRGGQGEGEARENPGRDITARIMDLSARQRRSDVSAAKVVSIADGVRAGPPSRQDIIDAARTALPPRVVIEIPLEACETLPRGEQAKRISALVDIYQAEEGLHFTALEQRDMVTYLLNDLHAAAKRLRPAAAEAVSNDPVAHRAPAERGAAPGGVEAICLRLQPLVMERIDIAAAVKMPRAELERQIAALVAELLVEQKANLNVREQQEVVTRLLDEMLGLGPLEPLLADESITDIMVNGPKQVYVERRGKLDLTEISFRDNAHVMNIATRIVSRIGRRVDEATPLVDARLLDGSRVNIIIPPLAIDGPSISIRKFAKKKITLDSMAATQSISPAMATVLKVASRCRLNVLISGGTGSGKTTLLNALSRMIDIGERVVTIEDAAELQLQQPHVVRLETRPSNLEGDGEITMRDLVKNALRMRPDRIILGEIRGAEALDMLQAMNTGHDGSMCTIHANRPREALTRLENMVGMTGINLPSKAVRTQIAAAVNLIAQVSRMRDGVRRVTHVVEVVGMEGDVVITQDLFTYQFEGEDSEGRLNGTFKSSGMRPHFLPRAEYFGLDRTLLEAL